MSLTPRKVSPAERDAIRESVPLLATLLIELGRNYVAAVRVQDGEANHAESRFKKALGDLIIVAVESGVLDKYA
jgi:hypothetical protein